MKYHVFLFHHNKSRQKVSFLPVHLNPAMCLVPGMGMGGVCDVQTLKIRAPDLVESYENELE